MSIRSKREILNEAANVDGASNEAILMAALNESQDEYKLLSGKIIMALNSYDKRIEALEAAVTASNTEKAQDYTGALKNASDAILGDLSSEVQQTIRSLQSARKENEKSETLDNIKIIAIAFAIIVSAFYTALILYGWWYDIPDAVEKLSAIDAINNGIYQLLQR